MTFKSSYAGSFQGSFLVNPTSLSRVFPEDATAWSTAWPTITAPMALWPMDESTLPLVDRVGAVDLASAGDDPVLGGASSDPLGRASVAWATSSDLLSTASSTLLDPEVGSWTLWLRDMQSADGCVAAKWDSSTSKGFSLAYLAGTLRLRANVAGGNILASTSIAADSEWRDLFAIIDWDNSVIRLVADGTEVGTAALPGTASGTAGGGNFRLRWTAGVGVGATGQTSYGAVFDYALTDEEVSTIITRV